ncbi:dihydrofolate reductase family protein [Aeropyrum camini]|uniref:dihydrofolate reductase family protein n=1 Tax=Aeropyrum camini TaxID=229980 RepID=UPI0007887A40|nr:dihydrofolate reductase family protein [Aeropyrum camini]
MARPYTFIFSTATLDGRIASVTGYSLLSCREDFELQHRYRASAGAVMVGSRTAVVDKPRLNVRLVPGRSPLRVIVDSRLRVPPEVAGLRRGSVLITTEGHSSERLRPYLERGVRIVEAGRGRVDLDRAVEVLREELGVRVLMVEGGGGLNCAMLEKGLVDEVRVTIAPSCSAGV